MNSALIRHSFGFPFPWVRERLLLDLLNELFLGQRGLEELNLVTLGLEDILTGLVYILEEQDLNVLSVEGLELLGRRAVGECGRHEAGAGDGRLEG